jgi:glycine cleavage system pyridoxal-binding protein P
LLKIKQHFQNDFSDCFAALLQSPGTNGEVRDLSADIEKAKMQNVLTIVACDLLALMGIAVTQKFIRLVFTIGTMCHHHRFSSSSWLI